MADNVLYNIASSLLIKLSSLAKDDICLLWNSKSELKKLRITLTTITDVLLDAERRQETDAAVRGWITRLKDEIYRADDLFDEITARALQNQVNNEMSKEVLLSFFKSNQFAFHMRTINEVKDLRERLDGIANDIKQYKFLVGGAGSLLELNIEMREQSNPFVREVDIIGREKEKQEMVQMLLAESLDSNVSVLTIVGIGGLGKSALAELIYNDKHVEKHFPTRLWACVNYFSDLNATLKKIVASGTREKHCRLELDQLAIMLMNEIRGQRFLLVLDDVCDDVLENWLKLKRVLDVGAQGSKVVVTTRLESVATNIGTPMSKVQLGGLSDSDAWSLFVKMALDPCQSKHDHEVEMIGRDIVKKCGNIPLVIRSVGSFLYRKDMKKWSSTLDNELAKLIPEDQNLIRKVLMITYNDFPPSLKQCFAYCSLFPKNHVYSKNSMTYLWMAQGFLDCQPPNNQSLEDVGEKYISHLIHRCFFKDETRDKFGGVLTFKIHDMLHDLAIDVARNQSLLINNVDLDQTKERSVRHVAYGLEVDFVNVVGLQQKCMRTLLFLERTIFSLVVWDRLILLMKNLRVLDISYSQMVTIPDSIGELVHLRYLDFSWNQELIVLPNSICELQLLQTLRLFKCSQLMNLPNDMQKLICLRQLVIGGCKKLMCIPSGLQELTSLVTLDEFVVAKNIGELRYLAPLNNLSGKLDVELPGDGWENSIVGTRGLITLKKNNKKEVILKSKTNLLELNIHFTNAGNIQKNRRKNYVLDILQPSNNLGILRLSHFGGTRVSRWISSLNNLTVLSIVGCSKCFHLPSFSELPQLKRLDLINIPLLEYIEDATSCYSIFQPFFPSLERLFIYKMPRLKGWWRHLEAQNSRDRLTYARTTTNPLGNVSSAPWFRLLSTIHLSYCPELASFPRFPCAQNVYFGGVSPKLLRQLSITNVANSFTSDVTYNFIPHSPYSNIKEMEISHVDLLSLPEEWMMHAATLRSLEISYCRELKSISPHLLQQLTALESLKIFQCRTLDILAKKECLEMLWTTFPMLTTLELDLSNSSYSAHLMKGLHQLTALEKLVISGYKPSNDIDRIMWIAPSNLKSLTVRGMMKVANYIEVFQQCSRIEQIVFSVCWVDGYQLDEIPWENLTNIRTLSFNNAYQMGSLPQRCLENLPNLQHLELDFCPKLYSLPSWVSNLQSLEIGDCRRLYRYKKPLGECWPEIRHIPYIYHFP